MYYWGFEEHLHSGSRVMSLFNGLVFSCEFGKKWAEAGGSSWWIPEFSAEVEVKTQPFVVFWVQGCGEPSLLEAMLESCLCLCGKGMDGEAHGQRTPVPRQHTDDCSPMD